MRRQLLLLALLAALLAAIPPALADDGSDFFALFGRTCAKSLTDPQAFVDAVKAAGATFKFALSGRPEADMARTAVAQLKLTLPRDLNDGVTATDVRAEDTTIVYVLEIRPGHEVPDMKGVQDAMTKKLCASAMRATIAGGVAVTYEYWIPGPTRKLRGKFNVAACP
jgi:hypothetical protein